MILHVWSDMNDYMVGAEAEEIESVDVEGSIVGGWKVETESEILLFPATCVIRIVKDDKE